MGEAVAFLSEYDKCQLQDQGQQSLKLACFYFGDQGAILPAFGAFTGIAVIPIQKEGLVFVITETEVLAV